MDSHSTRLDPDPEQATSSRRRCLAISEIRRTERREFREHLQHDRELLARVLILDVARLVADYGLQNPVVYRTPRYMPPGGP